MYNITWDIETGGVALHSRRVEGTLGTSPRPVFWEELDLLKLNELGWTYPHSEAPLLWAINKQYWYRGELVFEAKGASIYHEAKIELQPGKEQLNLQPVDMKKMLNRCSEYMFLLESEAIEFIRETYLQYAGARKSVNRVPANQINFDDLVKSVEKKTKTKMAIVKEDCDSFDIVPLDKAEKDGKKVYQTTKIDRFLASFSGGKDSQVVLDLCTRAIPSTDFEVVYSDTGYELPPSLKLYQEIQQHYQSLYPDLKFSTAKNHASVLSYWDKIGTPSDSHRWCCSIMKTAPLYRTFKIEGTNKQAKVLTFDGVRAEESLKRGKYGRTGKGKHTTIYNAHPILEWNAVEIFLYLFRHHLPINQAYRDGKARVGCVICPFSTSWDDMIATKKYPNELKPFTERLQSWSSINRISDAKKFIEDRRWKIKAIGNTDLTKVSVEFSEINHNFVAHVINSQFRIYLWLPTLCDYTVNSLEGKDIGTLNFRKRIYNFNVVYGANDYTLTIENPDVDLALLMRRVIYKSAYCINCEGCEVECPTGALSVVPQVKIDKSKCIHCHKCLTFHDLGCYSADSVRMIKNMNNSENAKIQGYKTFGFREEWLQEYLVDPEYFWHSNSLGTAQVDGFKAWLKDAEINDTKNKLTQFGELIQRIYQNEEALTWELILTNLSYHSFIVKWFLNNITVGKEFDRKTLETLINEQGYSAKGKTVSNAVAAFVQTLEYSPLGKDMKLGVPTENKTRVREFYEDVSNAGLVYNLYKYAEFKGVRSLRVSDFYIEDSINGPYKTLGVTKKKFQDVLRSLNSLDNRVLIAELAMGLDSITLRDDITPLSCIESLIK